MISCKCTSCFTKSLRISYTHTHTHTHKPSQSVSLTNYTDTERDLVKDMIRIIGIPYTGYLSRNTTHLICKR